MRNQMYKRIAGIYCIEVNDGSTIRKYVGQSVNLKPRINAHIALLKRNNHENQHLQNAWNKYGQEMFAFSTLEVLEECDELAFLLTEREQYYMDLYDSISNGFNILKASENHYTHNYSTPRVAYHMSDEQKKHLSDINTGRKHTDDAKEKIGKASREMVRSEKQLAALHPREPGFTTPEETKLKMSLSHIGKIRTPEHCESIRAAKLGKTRSPEAIEACKAGALRAKEERRQKEIEQLILDGAEFDITKITGFKKRTPEQCEKMGLNMRGKQHSDAAKAKMSAAQLKRFSKDISDK